MLTQKERMKKNMKKKILYCLSILIVLVAFGCGSSKEKAVVTKQVEIFGTKYTIHEGWTVDQSSEDTTIIYYTDEKPEKLADAIMITCIKGVLHNGTQYYQSREYVTLLKDTVLNSILDKVNLEIDYDKEKTAGLMCQGEKNGFENTVYFFMNNYTDALLIQCYHHPENGDKNHAEFEKEVIDSMEFSFDGFSKESPAQSGNGSGKTSNSSKDDQKELAKLVYNWCQDRFEYYDEKDGYYTGDKHDDDVFEDASRHFGKSKSEVRKLYDDGGYYIATGE